MGYLRKDLQNLLPYKADNKRYKVELNSNESPFDIPDDTKKRLISHINSGNIFRKYPDPDAVHLRKAIAKYCNVGLENTLVASGSDELIHMITNAFVDKGEYVLCPTPSFGMYEIYTQLAGGKPVKIQLGENYNFDPDSFLAAGDKYNAKMVFICNPNNPTGTVTDKKDIEYIAKNFNGVVVIDEAYFEFYGNTMIDLASKYDNIIILRTFSKAFGLAGLRIGYLIANKDLVDEVYITKSPYNINTFSQLAALELLKDFHIAKERIDYIVTERERLYEKLKSLDKVKVIPSKANFLLIKLDNSQYVYEKLLQAGILVRSFSENSPLSNCLRVSIGNKEENILFFNTLKSVLDGGR